MSKQLELRGKTFGRLKAIERVKGGAWKCLCSCGNEHIVLGSNLITGNTKSCGCLRRDRMPAVGSNNIKHYIEMDGVTKTLAQWCIEKHISYDTVYARINRRKWDEVRAITTPIRQLKRGDKNGRNEDRTLPETCEYPEAG